MYCPELKVSGTMRDFLSIINFVMFFDDFNRLSASWHIDSAPCNGLAFRACGELVIDMSAGNASGLSKAVGSGWWHDKTKLNGV